MVGAWGLCWCLLFYFKFLRVVLRACVPSAFYTQRERASFKRALVIVVRPITEPTQKAINGESWRRTEKKQRNPLWGGTEPPPDPRPPTGQFASRPEVGTRMKGAAAVTCRRLCRAPAGSETRGHEGSEPSRNNQRFCSLFAYLYNRVLFNTAHVVLI